MKAPAVAVALALVTLAAAASASAQHRRGRGRERTPEPALQGPAQEAPSAGSASVSVGSATNGHLEHGVELIDSRVLFVKPGSESTRHGTEELVRMVERVATSVAVAHPGPRLIVGDLSRRNGGRMGQHSSHRAGRDVDLGFYITLPDGTPYVGRSFIELTRRGKGQNREGHDVQMDLVRSWALLEALAADEGVEVQYILVAPHIRSLLLEHARAAGADPERLTRIEVLTEPRSGSASHDNHFHVRIYCSPDDEAECVDAPPYHPWAFRDEAHVNERLASYRGGGGPHRESRAVRRRRARHARGSMRASMSSMSTMRGHAAPDEADEPGLPEPALPSESPTLTAAP